jgi:type IX secretion system substrate protein
MKPALFKRLAVILLLCTCFSANSQSVSGVINSYYQVTAINTSSNTLTLNNTTGLTAGTKILLIQMKGATIDNSNTSTYGNITAINNAGNYEFNYICSISGNDVVLQIKLLNTYTVSEPVQLVTVPFYSTVTITDTVKSTPWDPVAGTGGIVVMEASTINLNSTIDVRGQGFIGGALVNYGPPDDCLWAVNVTDYYLSVPPSDIYHTGGKKGEGIADYITNEEYGRGKLASGGGGGNNSNTGGAGGSNYGAGGNGGQRTMESTFKCHGQNPGVGGLSLSTYGYTVAQNKIFFGGGGGSGQENNSVGLPGGNGGGIVILTASVITGSGTSILADGVSPINPTNTDPTQADGDGAGGGGAGGTVIINATTVTGNISVSANGANGTNSSRNIDDCTGPGGGGGAGVIWTSGSVFPTAITASVNGGVNGVVSSTSTIVACRGSANSATPGSNGNAQTGFVPPINNTYTCFPLPISDLKYFRGNLTDAAAVLSWGMYQTTGIASYKLESSADQVKYDSVTQINNNGNTSFTYNDYGKKEGTTYYRLALINTDGTIDYSQIVALTRTSSSSLQFISLQPNPVASNLTAVMYAKQSSTANVIVYNAFGQKINSFITQLNTGYTRINIPVANLSSGTYFLFIKGNNINTVKPFIKAASGIF